MGLAGLIMPVSLLLGTIVLGSWWLTTAAMFLVAFAGALGRAWGNTGLSMGLTVGLVFLAGLQIPTGLSGGVRLAAYYAGGAAWTIVVALVFWRLRPYRRLRQEIAACFTAVADLVAATRPSGRATGEPHDDAEERVASRYRAVREAIEQVRSSLGEAVVVTTGASSPIADLVTLLRSASRTAASVLSLWERVRADSSIAGADSVAALFDATGAELERGCRAVAAVVLTGRGRLDLTALAHRAQEVADLVAAPRDARRETNGGAVEMQHALAALTQAVRHLGSARDAAERLAFVRSRAPGVLLPPLYRAARDSDGHTALRSQLTLRSTLFRHALRVAVAAAAGTALFLRLELPHGIWVPLTVLIVLQPHFGGTIERALRRVGGTSVGAVIAGALVATLRGTAALDAAIIVLLFATLFFIRRHYATGVMFLTPFVILLLHTGGVAGWHNIEYRVLDTLLGGCIAVVAGYLLWPSWERARLPGELAKAVRANGAYLRGLLVAVAAGAPYDRSIADLRREAELSSGNADAAFRRVLAEPSRHRGDVARLLALVTGVQRLARHLTAIAVQLEHGAEPSPGIAAAARVLEEALEELAFAVESGRAPQRPIALEEAYGLLATSAHPVLASLFSTVMDDVIGLYAAAA